MNKLKECINEWSWADFGVASLLLVFCAFNKLMPVLMILTFLSLIKYRTSIKNTQKLLSFKYPFIWMLLFFLMHIVGLTYSENIEFGVSDIGMKLSFLLFPLFFVLTKLKLTFRKLADLYLLGILLAAVICFGYASYRSIDAYEDNHWSYFTASYFSYMMHRSYFGTYLALGTLIALVHFFKYELIKKKKTYFYLALTFLLFASTLLTFSKAAIIILILQIIPLMYFLLAKYSKKVYALLGVVALVVLLSTVFLTENRINARFSMMVKGLTEEKSIAKTDIESNSSRLIMWSTSIELMKEHPILGVGTGDIKDVLVKRNYDVGNIGVAELKLNSHNQYLNTAVQLGLLGFIPLIMIFITSFIIAFKKKNIILFMMTTTFFSTMLFESFLETQAGIIPVTFLILLFALTTINEKDETTYFNTILPS